MPERIKDASYAKYWRCMKNASLNDSRAPWVGKGVPGQTLPEAKE